MKKLRTPPSECCTMRTIKISKTRKERQCFGCLALFPKGCEFTLHKVIGINEIYNMYLCNECEDLSEQREYDIYEEGKLARVVDVF